LILEDRKARCTVAYSFLHNGERAIARGKHSVFFAEIRKTLQSLFLVFSKAESKMLAEITQKEFAIEFLPRAGIIRFRRSYGGQADPGYSFFDQIIKTGEIFVA
jgi:hypothetical protein